MEALPAKELRQMLSTRGVSLGSATEKAELAQWAFQHQDLPVVRSASSSGAGSSSAVQEVQATKSVAELKRMSVAELREMLKERGVGEGSASEKGELVQWVWQHQNLPVLHRATQQRKKGRRQGRWSFFGFGEASEPYDLPRDEKKKEDAPRQEQLEGSKPKELEGDAGQQLLEGKVEEQTPLSRRWWPWAVGGVSVAFFAVVGIVASRETLTSEPSE